MVISVSGGDLYSLADAFYYYYILRDDLRLIISGILPILLLEDSATLFNLLINTGTISREHRLMIYIQALRKSYSRQEISNISRITSRDNFADVFANLNRSNALDALLRSGMFDLYMVQWVTQHHP